MFAGAPVARISITATVMEAAKKTPHTRAVFRGSNTITPQGPILARNDYIGEITDF